MSKAALKLVDKLNQDYRWKFNSHGICIALSNGSPECCFIFDAWGQAEIDQLTAEMAKINRQFDLKLIGPPMFISTLRRWAKEQGQNVVKTIIRDVPFEMLYAANDRQFKINVQKGEEEEAPAPAAVHEIRPSAAKKIKVLIVDDSSTIRRVLTSIFKTDPNLEVIGALEKPSEVEPFILKQKPDVITMDIHMPEMDGVQLLRQIMPKYHIPTIMISSITKEDGPYVFDALEIGAFDYIQKPSFQDIPLLGPHIIERVRLAAGTQLSKEVKRVDVSQVSEQWPSNSFILIGASTGGTEALAKLFKQFPNEIPPVLVVQHIPPVFSKAFADRLNAMFKFEVHEAKDGDLVQKNKVLIAPGGKQMGIVKRGDQYKVVVNDDAPVNRHKPSVDYLFNTAVKLKMKPVVGVILTGMGADGAKGLLELRNLGARTIAQDEKTSVVYGMPRCAFEMGGAEAVAPLDQIGQKISRFLKAN